MAIYIESLTVESSTGLRGLEVLFGFMSAKVSKIKIMYVNKIPLSCLSFV